MTGSWLATFRPRPAPQLRLICVPYAGAGAAPFAPWARMAHPALEVVAVRLPGRESRLAEPCLTDVAQVVPPLARALAPLLDRPFALFGHSLGAAIAHDLAHHLAASGRVPRVLAVSGRHPPHRPSRHPPCHHLPEAAFRDRLGRLGGTPRLVLDSPDLMDLLAPMVRADFQMAETHGRRYPGPVPCPVLAFAGADDPLAPPEATAAWREVAGHGFDLRVLPGGHFFLHHHAATVMAAIMARMLPGDNAGAASPD